jgi:hypothetical protein
MTSEVGNEFKAKYDDRVRNIHQAAAAAIKELSLFRSGGPVTTEALDAEVARIAKEKLHPHGCDLIGKEECKAIRQTLTKLQTHVQ